MLMEVFCFADFAKRVGARRGEFKLFPSAGRRAYDCFGCEGTWGLSNSLKVCWKFVCCCRCCRGAWTGRAATTRNHSMSWWVLNFYARNRVFIYVLRTDLRSENIKFRWNRFFFSFVQCVKMISKMRWKIVKIVFVVFMWLFSKYSWFCKNLIHHAFDFCEHVNEDASVLFLPAVKLVGRLCLTLAMEQSRPPLAADRGSAEVRRTSANDSDVQWRQNSNK